MSVAGVRLEDTPAMDTGGSGYGPKCVIGEKFFTPDPGLGERQKCGGRPECRQQYKNRWQQAKYAKDVTFRAAVKARVRLWRWNARGGAGGKGPESGAGPPASASDLACVRDGVTLLEQRVAGWVSHRTGCQNEAELRPLPGRGAERGREVLGVNLSG
jgi:hypothetical protein